ncbi:hypothetical protein [uncultured Shewanella sp.]|uniref:hypothetical protein n=1 Tax=uncultured Shewanella sp. TaxID=173975 RepID=UPI002636D0D8|nr:hypothetical protein [uncultured Shewanella sp.]
MILKPILFILLFMMTSLSSYAAHSATSYGIEAASKSSLISSTKALATEQKQWLFVLSADKGRILKAKNKMTYELSLTHIDKGLIAITNDPIRETKIIPSITFLKNFTTTFSNAAPNAILTHSGLLTGEKSPPIAVVIENVTIIPDIKVVLSLHLLSANITLPEGDIREVKLFIDASKTPGPSAY